MAKALIIPADIAQDPYYRELDGLEDYQGVVGGQIETIPYEDNIAPYFNEEGKILGLPRNERATMLLRQSIFPNDYIAGDCIFVGFDYETGEDVDLPEGALRP